MGQTEREMKEERSDITGKLQKRGGEAAMVPDRGHCGKPRLNVSQRNTK